MRRAIGVTAAFVATVAAHGNITSPLARIPGPAMVKACGQTAVDAVLQDGTTPLEDVLQPKASCKLDLCRGAVFEDNKDRVQTFRPGQVVPMKAQLPILHEGPANVSIVDAATNTLLGPALLVFDTYADENAKVVPANNTAFSVTIPATLGTKCRVAGECVLQWFWFGTAAKQTYESCVDFVMAADAGGGGAAGTGTGKASAETGAATGAATSAASSAASARATSEATVRTKSTKPAPTSLSVSVSEAAASSTGSIGSSATAESSPSATKGSTSPAKNVQAGPALPDTGKDNFGGIEGSMATADIGLPATNQGDAESMGGMSGMTRRSRKRRMI